MKIRLFILFIYMGFFTIATADHITGGEMSYSYVNSSAGLHQYKGVMKLYMRCNSGRSFNDPTIISVFNRVTGNRIMDLSVPIARIEILQITNPDPCISNPPNVCYEVAFFEFLVSLPEIADGYTLAGQVNYRVTGISNLNPSYSLIGATYTAEIPGALSANNSSAQFTGSDLVIVCANSPFTYSFSATDNNSTDQLRYSFCSAFRSSNLGGGIMGGNSLPPKSPPYETVPYGNGYDGASPLGNSVSINTTNGIISGIAPGPGIYVITVCVEEWRNGALIATKRKDLQISITSCALTSAILLPEYLLCKDSRTLQASNRSTSSLIQTYFWEIKSRTGSIVTSSTNTLLSHNFKDTGTFTLTLYINRNDACSDSTTALVRVYPGFKPNFQEKGICPTKPTHFMDATTTVYGTVSKWFWDFGDLANTTDISTNKNVSYTYPSKGAKNVMLVASNTNGCVDTVVKIIDIVDRPSLKFSFNDTLICPPDNLQLISMSTGQITWSPLVNITNAQTATPTVSPTATITYYADLNDNGCKNRDSVLVRVTDKVVLQTMADTTICMGDRVTLRTSGNGLLFNWTPPENLLNPTLASPIATVNGFSRFSVTSRISSCTAKATIVVRTVPYPLVNAGLDTSICFGEKAFLLGTTNGKFIQWFPARNLSSSTSLQTTASPISTTHYILSVTDTLGCPKPEIDTVLVTVFTKLNAKVTGDTVIVIGQALPLLATGGEFYKWEPKTGISNPNIANPIALLSEPIENLRYKVLVTNNIGCTDSAFVNIKVFGTKPTVFVPTGFTPNGDGRNDLLRPVVAGIKQIEFFKVYNRWGQLVYSSNNANKSWDGKVNGHLQETAVYVWFVKAIDFQNKPFLNKGTITLIR